MKHSFSLLCVIISLLFSARVIAAALIVEVRDNKQKPFEGAVVSLHGPTLLAPEPVDIELTQADRRFAPDILIVTQGSSVRFANKDDITHHVYSFSKPWKKQFRLNQGESQSYFMMKEGEVVLGCNIHDWMLGYIYVMDTPVFGRTDIQGRYRMDIPAGEYSLHIQHPRLREKKGTMERSIIVEEGVDNSVVITFKKKLLPKRAQTPDLEKY